jgi:hypothetical protein
MTVTGRARTGRLKVVLVSDDNQNAAQTTRFLFLRVSVAGPGVRGTARPATTAPHQE